MGGSRQPGSDDPIARPASTRGRGALGLNVPPIDTPGSVGVGGDAAWNMSEGLHVASAAFPTESASSSRRIQDNARLFFDPRQSATFARVFRDAAALRVQIAPYLDIGNRRAIYDPLQNVIFVSPGEFKAPGRATHLSTAHELYHAIQNREIVAAGRTADERRSARDDRMLRMTEDQFVAHEVKREKAAEAFAWICDAEVAEYLSRTRHGGKGWPRSFHEELAETRVKEYWRQQGKVYEEEARKRYRNAASRREKKE